MCPGHSCRARALGHVVEEALRRTTRGPLGTQCGAALGSTQRREQAAIQIACALTHEVRLDEEAPLGLLDLAVGKQAAENGEQLAWAGRTHFGGEVDAGPPDDAPVADGVVESSSDREPLGAAPPTSPSTRSSRACAAR
jgi:hypothetical protein